MQPEKKFYESMYVAGRRTLCDKFNDHLIKDDLTPREGFHMAQVAYLLSATPEDEAVFTEVRNYYEVLWGKQLKESFDRISANFHNFRGVSE